MSIHSYLKYDPSEKYKSELVAIFIEDHTKIDHLLKRILNSPELEEFNNFKWKMEKHIYLEEKAFFKVCELEQKVDRDFYMHLKNDHDKIIELIEDIEKTLKDKELKNIPLEPFENIHQVLIDHVKFEVQFFYDYMEFHSTDKIKEYVLKHITESPTAGFYPLKSIRNYGEKLIKTIPNQKIYKEPENIKSS